MDQLFSMLKMLNPGYDFDHSNQIFSQETPAYNAAQKTGISFIFAHGCYLVWSWEGN